MSQIVKVPINSKPYQNVDDFTLTQFSDSLLDGYIDELGNTNKRPGTSIFKDLGTAKRIDGAYWWPTRKIAIFVSEGSVFKIGATASSPVNITGDKLLDNGRVSFTDNGTTLVMANGGRMVYTDGTANTQYIADADAPTVVTHVAFLDQWILANEVDTARFHYADFVGAPTSWLAVNVFSAEANPDNLISLYVNKRTIILHGTNSTEFWFNDGVTPFSRLQGTTTERGVVGRYSTVFANEVGYFIDNLRRLIRLEGNQPSIVSTPFDKTIQNFNTASDVLMDYISKDGRHLILMSFPTENRTLGYDMQSDYWFEWSYWEQATSTRSRFLGNCYIYSPDWNAHLFGHTTDGKIYSMVNDSYLDGVAHILFEKKTGHIDFDLPSKLKRGYRLTVKLKTGVGLPPEGSIVPYLRLRTKIDNRNVWGNYRYIPLNVRGETKSIVNIYNFGLFYSIQFEFSMAENVPFVIGEAYMEIDVNEF